MLGLLVIIVGIFLCFIGFLLWLVYLTVRGALRECDQIDEARRARR